MAREGRCDRHDPAHVGGFPRSWDFCAARTWSWRRRRRQVLAAINAIDDVFNLFDPERAGRMDFDTCAHLQLNR